MSEPVATGMKKYKPRTWDEAKTCSAVALQRKKNISDDHDAGFCTIPTVLQVLNICQNHFTVEVKIGHCYQFLYYLGQYNYMYFMYVFVVLCLSDIYVKDFLIEG